MATEVTLPALGESVTEGTISRWLKEVGEEVAADEPLLEVSTDKVDTEIPSPASGVLLEIKFQEDDVAEVGAVLAIIGNANEGTGDAKGSPDEPDADVAAEPSTEQPAPDQLDEGADQPKEDASAQQETKPEGGQSGKAEGTEIKLPALGESVTEGTISRWLKEVGDQVEADEAIVEVSTDKVDTEIPAPASGVLLEIRVQEDDVAEVGSVLGIIGDPDAKPAAADEQPKQEDKPVEEAQPEKQAESDSQPAQPKSGTSDVQAESPKQAGQSAVRNEIAPRAAGNEDVYVTPVVRKMAADLGVDLSSVEGTGVGGRIRKQDVQAAADAKQAPAAPASQPAAAKPADKAAAPKAPAGQDAAKRGTVEKVPRLRKVIAQRMTESLQVAAQLTATVEVDMTAISALRDQVKVDFKKREGSSLTYLAFITKAVTEALQVYPKLNASLDLEAGEITYHDAEHIGIAVDTERGLLVPVIKNAGDLNVGGIAKQIDQLASRVRNNEAGPDELSGATFTITNYGSTGTLFDTPIINQPNSAILGTGALVKRPVVVTDEFGKDVIAIRGMMYLSMTYDHRLVDGADASRFLAAVKQRLEDGDFGADFGL